MNTYPFSDDYMTYNDKTHRYTLTKKAVFDWLGINLDTRLNVSRLDNASAAADIALQGISRHIYGYIYARTRYKTYIEYVLAKNPECRGILQQAMLNEVDYTINNGDFWQYAGVNLSEGRAMDLSTLRDARVVSADTEQLLYQPLSCGLMLCYQGNMSIPPFLAYEGY